MKKKEEFNSMKIKILFCLIVLISQNKLFSQNLRVPKTEFLNFLYHRNINISEITNLDPFNQILHLNDKKLIGHTQKIIRTKNGLFILIDQTGRVYKATEEKSNELIFTRQDSTYYWGYNGGSIDFSRNDTIYSFGGYGIWRTNGQLRYFSTVYNEWNIVAISEEYPATNYLNFINSETKFLYFIQKPFIDAVTNKQISGWHLFRLNLSSKENLLLGDITGTLLSQLSNNYITRKINLPSLNGLAVFLPTGSILLMKFDTNEIFKSTNNTLNDILLGNANNTQIRNSFEIGDTLYYTLSGDSISKLHSLFINPKDFIKEPYPIYQNPIQTSQYLIPSILFSFISIIILLWFLKKKKALVFKNTYQSLLDKNPEDQNNFNAVEQNLIKQIILCSEKGDYLTGEQMHTILGVAKKSIETQKKVRGDTINRINFKFKNLYEKDVDLIERIRSDNDRRYYNYFISKENSKIYKSKNK